MFCLIPKVADKFKQGLISGEIDPAKLNKMTSEERRTFFEGWVGKDNAKETNALFESKLLLKNQQTGMINWAKQMIGDKKATKQDIISKIQRLEKVLSPEEESTFLEDLVSQKLGTEVTFNEAKVMSDLTRRFSEAEKNLKKDSPIGSPDRLEYGASKVALQNYINELKVSNIKIPLHKYLNPWILVREIAGSAKGIKASLDNSALFNQGWKAVFTNPKIWGDNALKSFTYIWKQLGLKPNDDSILNGIKADIFSRPNSINNLYKKMKLDIGDREEAFPTSFPEKIPLFGRLYKASEVAYTGFLYRLRADIADKMIDIAQKCDVDLRDEFEVRSIGKVVNSLTGRGYWGKKLDPAMQTSGFANKVFFSPKKLMGDINFLTLHAGDHISVFARKQAALNLLKVTTGAATILAIAKTLNPNGAELNPQSSDYGKIKVGDTRFNITGGITPIITLAARLITQQSKSSTSGNVSQINSGKFGAQTSADLVVNFLENKLSPIGSLVKDLLNRTDFSGKPITVQGELSNLLIPLPISNAQELIANKNSANILLAMIADSVGIVTNTYSAPIKKKASTLINKKTTSKKSSLLNK